MVMITGGHSLSGCGSGLYDVFKNLSTAMGQVCMMFSKTVAWQRGCGRVHTEF